MATIREITNIHVSPPYLKIWYKTNKLLFRFFSFGKPGCKHSLPADWAVGFYFCVCQIILVLQPMKDQPLFSAHLFIKTWIKGWTTRSKLGEEGAQAVLQTATVCTCTEPPVICFHQWWCGHHIIQLSLDPLIKFNKIIIFCFYHEIAQTMLNQEFFSLLMLIKDIPIKQGLWTIVHSKNL